MSYKAKTVFLLCRVDLPEPQMQLPFDKQHLQRDFRGQHHRHRDAGIRSGGVFGDYRGERQLPVGWYGLCPEDPHLGTW